MIENIQISGCCPINENCGHYCKIFLDDGRKKKSFLSGGTILAIIQDIKEKEKIVYQDSETSSDHFDAGKYHPDYLRLERFCQPTGANITEAAISGIFWENELKRRRL